MGLRVPVKFMSSTNLLHATLISSHLETRSCRRCYQHTRFGSAVAPDHAIISSLLKSHLHEAITGMCAQASIERLQEFDAAAAAGLRIVAATGQMSDADFKELLEVEGCPHSMSRQTYVQRAVHHHLVGSIEWQSAAFAQVCCTHMTSDACVLSGLRMLALLADRVSRARLYNVIQIRSHWAIICDMSRYLIPGCIYACRFVSVHDDKHASNYQATASECSALSSAQPRPRAAALQPELLVLTGIYFTQVQIGGSCVYHRASSRRCPWLCCSTGASRPPTW